MQNIYLRKPALHKAVSGLSHEEQQKHIYHFVCKYMVMLPLHCIPCFQNSNSILRNGEKFMDKMEHKSQKYLYKLESINVKLKTSVGCLQILGTHG